MKVLILCWTLWLDLALASKRRYQSAGNDALRPTKKLKTEPVSSNLFIPVDIMHLIFTHVFDELPLKKTMLDPLKKYRLVCKEWLARLISSEFTEFTLSHPKYALLKLKRLYSVDSDSKRKLLHAASPIIDISVAMRLLFTATSGKSVASLSTLPAFLRDMSKKACNLHLRFGFRKNLLSRLLLPKDTKLGNIKRKERKIMINFLINTDYFVLDEIPIVDVLKLCLLEHIYKPHKFSLMNYFVAEQINDIYRVCGHGIAKPLIKDPKPLIQGLNYVLPKSQINGLFYTLGFSMFIACYIGEREYFKFLDIDIPLMIQQTQKSKYQEVLKIFDSFVKGDLEEYPADQLDKVKNIVRDRSVGFTGFEREDIRARSQVIFNDLTTPAPIRAMVYSALR